MVDKNTLNKIDTIMSLLKSIGYDDVLREAKRYSEWKMELYKTDIFDSLGIRVCSGMTRHVIVPDNCDFVIKIGYCRSDDFQNADEAMIYDLAESHGLAEFFAPMQYAKDYYVDNLRIPLYIMAKCDVDEEGLADLSYDKVWDAKRQELGEHPTDEELDDLSDSLESGSSEIMYDYSYLYYGEKASALWDFIDQLGVNDLHSGNWGWLNGKLVLTDYSGYRNSINRHAFA